MRYMLAEKNTLIIRGPASLRLLGGTAFVLGASLEYNNGLIVKEEKQLPVEAETQVDLDIALGKSGEFFEIQGSTIPHSWESAAEALAEMEQGKVMVVGATDVGKSTLCTYLTNRLLSQGVKLRVVDGDVGQADIGPPTTTGCSVPSAQISTIADLEPEALIFIGHTSPTQVENKITHALKRLSNRSDDSLTIINTDGWVSDAEAVSYKVGLITAIKPDLILGLSAGTELQPILSGSSAQTLKVENAKEVLARSRSDRRKIREASYRRFLDGARTTTIFLHGIGLSTPAGPTPFKGAKARDMSGLVVGLLDHEGYMRQFGILMGLTQDSATVFCSFTDGVHKLEVGYVRLSIEGTEVGYFEG